MVALCLLRVNRKLDLPLPVKCLSGLCHLDVLLKGLLVPPRNVSHMACNPCGDYPFPHILHGGKLQMFRGGYITEKISSGLAGNGSPNGAGDMIISRRDIGDQWSENIKGSSFA